MELLRSKDDLVFWIAGYTVDGNTENVLQMIESLQANAQKFAEAVRCDKDKVCTLHVNKSRRYKYMRVFYAKYEHCGKYKNQTIESNMIDFLTD